MDAPERQKYIDRARERDRESQREKDRYRERQRHRFCAGLQGGDQETDGWPRGPSHSNWLACAEASARNLFMGHCVRPTFQTALLSILVLCIYNRTITRAPILAAKETSRTKYIPSRDWSTPVHGHFGCLCNMPVDPCRCPQQRHQNLQ